MGESEYGEKADIRERSGEGSIGDFNAIIIIEDQMRPQKVSKIVWSINCRAKSRDAVGEKQLRSTDEAKSEDMRGRSLGSLWDSKPSAQHLIVSSYS